MLTRFRRWIRSRTPWFVLPAVVLATRLAEAQTGTHGYVVGGLAVAECIDGCPPTGPVYGQAALIGGGFGYPLLRGRVWLAGDVTSRISSGYLDASGGPSALVAIGSFGERRLEAFVQGGPRWGESRNLQWNLGGGANIWTGSRLGIRVEYQYQWENTALFEQAFGPEGPIGPPTRLPLTLREHLLRVGVVIR